MNICITVLSLFSALSVASDTQSYGNANVTVVHRLDEYVRIYCDIADFPPVIGQNIPVSIKDLKPAEDPKNNLTLLMFLNDLLLSKDSTTNKIVLKNIERGSQFCLIADVEVDGQNLCDLLVDKKLAQKVIEVTPSQKTESRTPEPTHESGYLATKSSKVFHRSSCQHAKRINTANAVSFSLREDAEKTGRRPCKTCKP
jgi:hypothetical protein